MVMTRRMRSESRDSSVGTAQPQEEELQNRVDDTKEQDNVETDDSIMLDSINETPVDNRIEKGEKEELGEDKVSSSDGDGDEDEDEDGDNNEDINPKEREQHQWETKVKTISARHERRKKEKNELTHLIPGYTAPMKLSTSSLDRYRPSGGITALQRKAERTDASTKHFVVESAKKHTDSMQRSSTGLLPTSYSAAYSSFKKGMKRAPDDTAGKGWFGMTPTPMTDELKTDLAVIRNRSYLDPKKFYKSAEKHHKIVQVGTVIEGAAEFYSSRLTKKERRTNFTEEIMADPDSADWARNKFKKMSREKTNQQKQRIHKAKRGKRFF